MNLQSCQCAKSFLSPLNGILCAVAPHAASQAGFNDLWILNLMRACCWSAAIERHRVETPFWYRLNGSLLTVRRHCRWRVIAGENPVPSVVRNLQRRPLAGKARKTSLLRLFQQNTHSQLSDVCRS